MLAYNAALQVAWAPLKEGLAPSALRTARRVQCPNPGVFADGHRHTLVYAWQKKVLGIGTREQTVWPHYSTHYVRGASDLILQNCLTFFSMCAQFSA